MKHAKVLLLVCLAFSLAGCNNFWVNYYSIEPGLTTRQQVRDLLGKPFVEAPDGSKYVYDSPQSRDKGETQSMEIYFNDAGVVVARVRTNPALDPPDPLDGSQRRRDEIVGKVPEFGPNKAEAKVRTK